MNLLFSLSSCLLLAGAWGQRNNYIRIEVLLERFENPDGILHDGSRCDATSQCDVEIKTAFDLTTPSARYPGSATTPQHFQKTARYREANVINMQQKMQRDICNRPSRLPSDVTIRIQANDKDVATNDDLIDEMDCTFPFSPVTKREDNDWSETRTCRGIRHPQKIRITYKYRIYTIPASECRDKDITNEEWFRGVHGENRVGQPAPGR